MPHPFENFLEQFLPSFEKKSTQLNKASWILETVGSSDAADLKADLDTELRMQLHDAKAYQKLLNWEKDSSLKDPRLKRQLNVLLRMFKQQQIPQELVERMAKEEADLAQCYAQFRPLLNGKPVSENEIRDILKNEEVVETRRAAWEASKQIGEALAPRILSLVSLRNRAAQHLGYLDFFQMQLQLQEVDPKWLTRTFDDLAARSDAAYGKMVREVEQGQAKRFGVAPSELGPWAWSEPFAQEDPLDSQSLDTLLSGVDIPQTCAHFYQKMGIDVGPILACSDLWERPGKNQHAFCTNIDRKQDVRTLNNIKPTIKWLETVLHELGHAIYEIGFDSALPYLLRQPPHMITTEAMALLAGRQAYQYGSLKILLGPFSKSDSLMKTAEESLKRRQLIFSRWVLVMTAFESALYRNPAQDLNALWWHFVEKYQKIRPPKCREGKSDWAAKYHIGLAPVYYFSYLLGELFASAIQEALERKTGVASLAHLEAGRFLNEKLFAPGDTMAWDLLVQHVTGAPLSPGAWLKEFATP